MQTTKIFNAGERKLRIPGKQKALTLFCPVGCKTPVHKFIAGEYMTPIIIVVGNKAYILLSGVWRDVPEIYVFQSGAWKEVTTAYVLNSNVWKETI